MSLINREDVLRAIKRAFPSEYPGDANWWLTASLADAIVALSAQVGETEAVRILRDYEAARAFLSGQEEKK